MIGGSIHSLAEDSLREVNIVGDAGRCQVVRCALKDIQYRINLSIGILGHHLEWSKQLSCQQLSLCLGTEMLEWHKDSSGLVSSILLWNGVTLQWCTSKENLSAIKLQNSIQVSLDLLIVPCEYRSNCQVI